MTKVKILKLISQSLDFKCVLIKPKKNIGEKRVHKKKLKRDYMSDIFNILFLDVPSQLHRVHRESHTRIASFKSYLPEFPIL